VATAAALASSSPEKKDTTKCWNLKNYACATTCEDSVYIVGVCIDDREGSGSAISVECCCTEGANHRSYYRGV
jgi:hypothetical protein